MARLTIVMPQMGESITTGTITKWVKKVDDLIEIDEILFEISTDKVQSEIPSPYKGRLVNILHKEGETVDVGRPVAEIEEDINMEVQAKQVEVRPTKRSEPAPETAPETTPAQEQKSEKFYTPLVRSMARTHGIDLRELDSLKGSGTNGRITAEDFEKYLESKKQSTVTPTIPTTPITTKTVSAKNIEIIPMDNMRKTIAQNMVKSKLTSPHVNSIADVDVTELVKFRESFKDEFFKQEGFKLTYTPFIMRAIILALKDYPLVNSSVEGDNILQKKDINLGFAAAVPGHGLVVPVVHQADTLSMTGLCRTVNTLALKARGRKLTLDELQGGTYTFTNLGSFGTLMGTPIILQPQLGIYASGVIHKRVVAMDDDSIAIRQMMYGVHTYDHRVIDGELGGKFLNAIHNHLKIMDYKNLF